MDQSLLRLRYPKSFTGPNNQEDPTVFDTFMRYTLWDLGCTHSVNTYFELYTEYKPLGKEDDAKVNGIGGIIKPEGIGTVVLELEDDTGKIHNLTFKQVQ